MATKKKIGRPLKSSRNSEVDSKNSGVGKCDPDEFLKKELLEKASTTLKVSPKSLLPLTKSQLCEIVDGKSPSKVSTKAVAAVQRKTVPTKKGRPAGATTKKVTTVGSSAKKVGKSVPATRTTEKCPGGKKKAEVAELVSKKFKVSQEEALRLKVAEMCDALATSTPPTIPPPKKVRPKYSPEFISVGSPTRKRKTSKKSLPPLAATPSPLRFVKIGVEVPRSPKAKVPLPRNVKDLECVRKSKLALKDYQLRVVNHFQTNRGLIVAHPVGSGKTLEGVTVVACFLNKHPKGIAKIVTPVSLQYNFQKELKAAGVSSDRIEFYTLAAFAKQHAAGGDKYGTCKGASSSRGGGRPVILVVDEAHELRTNISKARASGKITRAEVAVKCAMEADEVLLLTATAVYNEPYDVASLVAMAKGTVPLSIKSFEALVNSPDPARFRDYFGCMFSFHDMPRDENYPSVTKRYIEIEMSAKYFKEYKEVERRNSSLFSGKNPFLFLSGVRRASNALSSCPKCDVVMNFVNFGLPVKVDSRGTPTFSTTRPKKPVKIVVFSAFREYGIDKLAERLKTAKVPFGEVQGSMSKESRQRSVDRYNSDQDQVLLITAAGGQGLDLKGTRVMIIFEEQWNKSIEEQVEGRAVRYRSHAHLPESERNVQIYHLIMVKPQSSTDKRPSADVILRNLVEEKGVNNMKFLKRLQAVSIEQMTCGAHPISSSPPKFSPVAKVQKKSRPKKERTWEKLFGLSKKIFARGKNYEESNDDFGLRIGADIILVDQQRRKKIKTDGVIIWTWDLSEEPLSAFIWNKGDFIPVNFEKSATLLETLLNEVLLGKTVKVPSPKKSPVKSSVSEAAYAELFLEAYENIKDRSGDWKSFGSNDRFTEGSFARKFPDLGLDKGRGNFGQWMTMLLPDVWSTSILMRPTGSVDVDFNNKSGKNIPYDQAPPATRKRATEALEFLSNMKFASGSPLKPPTVMGAPLIKSPVQKTLGERMSKLDYTRLFMEAYENIKDPKYWSSGYFDFDFSASKFGGSTYVRDESKSGEKKIDLFYDVRKDIYLTTLRIASTRNTTVDFLTVYGSSIAYEKVPDSVLNAAIERLEFLRDLELEYFMDKFYNRLVRNFDRAREIYGKKEVNWAKIPGTSYEFSLVGKTLGIQLKKVGMVTYSEGNQKLIFYDEKGQMQNPYKLGDSQFGKWLPLKEHPAKIQNFFSTMTVGMGELEKYFAKKL